MSGQRRNLTSLDPRDHLRAGRAIAGSPAGQVVLTTGGAVAGGFIGGPMGAVAGAQVGSTIAGAAANYEQGREVEREARRAARAEEAEQTAEQERLASQERAAAIAAGRRRDRILRVAAMGASGRGGVGLSGRAITGAGMISA